MIVTGPGAYTVEDDRIAGPRVGQVDDLGVGLGDHRRLDAGQEPVVGHLAQLVNDDKVGSQAARSTARGGYDLVNTPAHRVDALLSGPPTDTATGRDEFGELGNQRLGEFAVEGARHP